MKSFPDKRCLQFAGLLTGLLPLLSACNAHTDSVPPVPAVQAKVDALVKKSLARLSYVQAGGFWLGDVGQLMNDHLKETGAVLGPDAKPQENPGYTYSEDNKPPRWVTLDAFSIQQYKVTYGDFDVYVAANGLPQHPPAGSEDYQAIWRDARSGDDVPAGVTWEQARAYCEWLGKVSGQSVGLPTEAQWEFAASNGRKTHWEPVPTDNGIQDQGRNVPAYEQKKLMIGRHGALYPVGRFPPSKLHLSDLVGDGFEWAQDWYKADEYQTMLTTHNPVGPPGGTEKVLRGYPTNEDMGGFPHTLRYHEPPTGMKLNGEPRPYAWESFRCVINSKLPIAGSFVDAPGPVKMN